MVKLLMFASFLHCKVTIFLCKEFLKNQLKLQKKKLNELMGTLVLVPPIYYLRFILVLLQAFSMHFHPYLHMSLFKEYIYVYIQYNFLF